MNQFDPKIAEAMEHALKVQKIMTELGHTKYTICDIVSRQMLHDSEQEVSVLLGKLHKVTEQRDEALSDLQFRRDLYSLQTKQLDDAREQRDELAKALKEILPLLPAASCDMFHHSKIDRHDYTEECKPLARYNSKIKKAEEALMIYKTGK